MEKSQIKRDKVILSIEFWNMLKADPSFSELIELIEESIDLERAKDEAKYFISFEDYDRKRKLRMKQQTSVKKAVRTRKKARV